MVLLLVSLTDNVL